MVNMDKYMQPEYIALVVILLLGVILIAFVRSIREEPEVCAVPDEVLKERIVTALLDVLQTSTDAVDFGKRCEPIFEAYKTLLTKKK